MGEALATFAVEQILEKVISPAAQQITLLRGFKQDLKKLEDSLRVIQALLLDADKKQIENKAIRIWMQKLQDLAYDAEDVLDEFDYELLRRKIHIRSQLKKVSSFFSYQNPVLFRFKMAHKLKSINEELKDIRSESSGLGLVPFRNMEYNIEETDSYLDNSEVIGRDDEVSKILNLIDQDSNNISVIPIVGMPGIGKTTLARLLSEQIEESNKFEERMWLCVSNTFDEVNILRGMLQSVDKTAGGIDHIDAILKHLREKLKDKSFFLVLDDVWNEDRDKWEGLMNRLLKINKNRKNCILITTRSEGVALITETTPMHRYCPSKLSDDQCWRIIKKKVFGTIFEEIPQDLSDIGSHIARKCAGLPLLAMVLGGTMRLTKTIVGWTSIRDSAVWTNLEENKNIIPVLKLSFDRLSSSSLKKCFAYCAIFLEDYVIEKNKLIQMWIAQDYIHQDCERNMTVEDVGEEYFKILLANSLFQDIQTDEFQNIRSCKMHDAVHGLAVFVSKSEIWISNSGLLDDMANIRHIRLQSKHILTSSEKIHSQKIRSLFSDVEVNSSTLRGLKGIRVMDICGSNSTDLSTKFVGRKHLRYLDISKSTINIQPRLIAKLCNLQTLRFVNYRGQMKPLLGIEHLINLKHVIFNNPKLIPSYVGRLIYLQTLPIFAVETRKGHGVEELGSLKHLRGELELQKLENVKGKSNAGEAKIEGKPKLQKLTYIWSKIERGSYWRPRPPDTRERNNAKDVLEGLKPHRGLLGLRIHNFFGESFSSWLSDHDLLGRLRRLELIDCQNCFELPTLGEMPSLEYLVIQNIKNVKSIGIEFYSRGDLVGAVKVRVTLFPALIELNMYGMSDLEEWVSPIEDGIITFPYLEIFTIKECYYLKRIPVIQSKSLRKLDIRFCENLSNLERVNESGSLVDLFIYKSGISIIPTFSNSLQYISLSWLPNLTTIPENLGDLTCLTEFEIYNCKALTNMPIRLPSCQSLKSVTIKSCEKLENVPKNLGEMSSLEGLYIEGCPKVMSLVNIPIRHHRLKEVQIGGFTKIEEFPNLDDRDNSSVRVLRLVGWDKLRFIPYLQHFTSLEELQIESFDQLEDLPEWLGSLSSLVKLVITNCKSLRSLPESMPDLSSLVKLVISNCQILGSLPESMARFTNLKELHINVCPVLVSKLRSQEGITEYSKISHIESIMIDRSRFLP